MKPIIGIVGKPHTTYTDRYCICALDGYRRAISNNGGIPILIMPTQNVCYEETRPRFAKKLTKEEEQDLVTQINLCDGIILPGGNRIYNYDTFVADYVLKNDIPVLGTCMGMQLMASIDCNEDREKVLEFIENKINHNQIPEKYVHKVKIEKDTKLFNIIGEEIILVNSRHKYAITKVNTAKVNAVSEDGILEGIEFENKKFAIGVQWHPEDMSLYDKNMEKLIKAFIQATKK